MKSKLTIVSAISIVLITLNSCTNESASEDSNLTNESNSNENILLNNVYLYPNDNTGYYFYDNDSCLDIHNSDYDEVEGIFSYPVDYKISGNKVTIDGEVYRILGDKAILYEKTFQDSKDEGGRTPLFKSNDLAPLH